MTKQEVLEAASVMIAYANGKKIGTRPRRSTEPLLGILYVPTWNWEQKEYCVIPDPTYRPWTADEVPLGAFLRYKGNPRSICILIVSNMEKGLAGYQTNWTYQALLQEMEHSTDGGKNWLPCGVLEEAK